MSLGTLGAIILGNQLGQVKEQLEQVKAQLQQAKIVYSALCFNKFEIQKYYQYEPKFNVVYSRIIYLKQRMEHM